jgi:hypothetical protein
MASGRGGQREGRFGERATGVKVLAPVKKSDVDIMMAMTTYLFVEQAPVA